MALINSYNHSSQLFRPVNYNTIVHFGSSDRRPTSAARTGARSELNCQSTNKPDRGRDLPTSAARGDLTQPRTSSGYGLGSALSRGASGPRSASQQIILLINCLDILLRRGWCPPHSDLSVL